MPCEQDEDVAIFWDYENCHPPSHLSGYDIVQRLRHAGHKFGAIKLFKAYFELKDPSAFSKTLTLRSELQCSGVSITDCPHNGRKDVADKMIMVDMLAYAIDNPAPSTIILISGDRDFAYAVSILRLRRYRVVVVSLSGIHYSLKAQASVFFDWATDILGVEVNEESFHLREEQRTTVAVPLSPVKSKIALANTRKPPPQALQNAQSVEDEEVDIMTHLSAARTRGKIKPFPSSPAPVPVPLPSTPRTSVNHIQVQECLPSVAEDDSDAFSCPSPTPSRTESAPPALETETRIISAPSTVVDTANDYVDKGNGSPAIPKKQITPEPKAVPLPKPEPPQQKPPAKLDNTVVSSLVASVTSAASSPEIAKAVISPAPIAVKTTQTAVAQITSSITVEAAPQDISGPHIPSNSTNPAILAKFRLLIERLDVYRTKGTARPLRSTIAIELATRDNEVYRRAGVQRFSQYSALAEKEGVIELGGREGGAWISLCPAWHGAKLS